MKINRLKKIPKALAISGYRGSHRLFKIKKGALFLDLLLDLKREENDLIGLDKISAEISARVWAINYIIELEDKYRFKNIETEASCEVPEIPERMPLSSQHATKRLKRLRNIAKKIDRIINKKLEKRDFKNIESMEIELLALNWMIKHIINFEENIKLEK